MRHSDIATNADLHYAKFRVFSGSPAAVQPDFIDQIFSSSDTNKIYRSFGTQTGDLIELAPQSQGGGGGTVDQSDIKVIDISDSDPANLSPDKDYFLLGSSSTRILVLPSAGDGSVIRIAIKDYIGLLGTTAEIAHFANGSYWASFSGSPDSGSGAYAQLSEGDNTLIYKAGTWHLMPPQYLNEYYL